MSAAAARCLAVSVALSFSATQGGWAQADPPVARGVVRALNQTSISTDLAVPVLRTPMREGQTFKSGDVVLELNCRRLNAEHDAVAAVAREMKLILDSQVIIVRHGAGGRNDLEVSRARYDKADAERRAHVARLDQCKVIAPYDGIVVELAVREYETTTPGKLVIALLDTKSVEIEIIVDTSQLRSLGIGQVFDFQIDELGRKVAVRLDRIGGAADPVSRTIKIIGVPLEVVPGLLPGMSGAAHLRQ